MTTRLQKLTRLGLVALLLGGVAASAAPVVAAELGPYPGALPDTPSAVDVSGRGEFSDLKIHVNQTADLTTQAVSLTWNWPGRSTQVGESGVFGLAYDANVLRIMQCWGDPVTTAADDDAVARANLVPDDPGPAREHCVYGGSLTNATGITAHNQQNRTADSYVTKTPTHYGQETAYKPEPGRSADIPFVAANGKVVAHQTERNSNGISVYANEFYDQYSTNESPANYTFGPDGRGGVQFQVQNSVDSRGLGCGAQKAGGGALNKCWLAIVPQGTTDLDGKAFAPKRAGGYWSDYAYGSPLASTNWANRIVVPLDFLPSTTACASAGNTYETLGSPLVANALLSWQSKLCGSTGTIFNYAQGTDQRSRDALSSGTTSMQFTSDPVPAASVSTPITYAPVTLSGLGLAFVWDKATQDTNTFTKTPGQPLPTIRLNQRLVAKLLTYSYVQGNPYRIGTNGAERKPDPADYAWLTKNPTWLGADPEFLALNPEVGDLPQGSVLLQSSPALGFVQGPLDGSDGIRRLWQWVMTDGDARAFLGGKPDNGMNVNPWYSTDATLNPSGFAFDTAIDGLPYADPWAGVPGSAAKLCPEQTTLSMSDIRPAARDLTTVARDVLTVNTLERYTVFQCPAGATIDSPVGWKSSRPGVVIAGARQLMGLTDTASGAQFGVTFASLRNASDQYVAPTTAAIAAAAGHLVDTGVQGVQQPDLATKDPAAYPLSLIGYAGVTTDGTPQDACAAYAELLDYAAGAGQQSGTSIGQLPPGYVPLSATLRQQTATAAKTVAQCAQTPTAAAVPVAAPVADTPVDTGASADVPAVTDDPAPVAEVAPPGATTQTQAPSLAAANRTKPDPSVFAWVVPIALVVGLLALLTAPLSGLRTRRPPPGTRG